MNKMASACLFGLKVSLIGSLYILSLSSTGNRSMITRSASGLKVALGQDKIPYEV